MSVKGADVDCGGGGCGAGTLCPCHWESLVSEFAYAGVSRSQKEGMRLWLLKFLSAALEDCWIFCLVVCRELSIGDRVVWQSFRPSGLLFVCVFFFLK